MSGGIDTTTTEREERFAEMVRWKAVDFRLPTEHGEYLVTLWDEKENGLRPWVLLYYPPITAEQMERLTEGGKWEVAWSAGEGWLDVPEGCRVLAWREIGELFPAPEEAR